MENRSIGRSDRTLTHLISFAPCSEWQLIPDQPLVNRAAKEEREPIVTDAANWTNGRNGRKSDLRHESKVLAHHGNKRAFSTKID
jgi:hypothetical protein